MQNKLILILLLIFLPLFVFAQDAPKGEYDDVAKEIEKQIVKQKKVNIDNLKVLHNGDAIYLEGVTELYGSRYVAEQVARKTKGIKTVDNQIAVKSNRDVSDNEIQAELIRQVNHNLKGSPFDLVGVEVNHGFVKFTGTVQDQTLPEKIMKDAIWTPGVRDVSNQIQYASISVGDSRLRQTIYTRLKAQYPQYFIGKQPSIIIVVDGGRVLLTGYVNSEGEKQKISSSIRSMTGVLSLNNQLQVGS
jgi:osmotically-inducible protein OsmY